MKTWSEVNIILNEIKSLNLSSLPIFQSLSWSSSARSSTYLTKLTSYSYSSCIRVIIPKFTWYLICPRTWSNYKIIILVLMKHTFSRCWCIKISLSTCSRESWCSTWFPFGRRIVPSFIQFHFRLISTRSRNVPCITDLWVIKPLSWSGYADSTTTLELGIYTKTILPLCSWCQVISSRSRELLGIILERTVSRCFRSQRKASWGVIQWWLWIISPWSWNTDVMRRVFFQINFSKVLSTHSKWISLVLGCLREGRLVVVLAWRRRIISCD